MSNDPYNKDFSFFVENAYDENTDEAYSEDANEEKISDVDYPPLDLMGAYDALNKDRDDMYGLNTQQASQITIAPQSLNSATIKDFLNKNGLTMFLNLVKDSLYDAGYTKFGEAGFLNSKTGILIKF